MSSESGAAPGAPHRYLFVVTYGRSGSTLTQGLLNTLPRTLVRGENNFYLLELFRAYAQARSFKEKHAKHRAHESSSAFYGLHELRPRGFVRATHDLVVDQLLGSTEPHEVDVLGFKEVLWHRVKPAETVSFFRFLDRAFPDAHYVLNRRDHKQVIGSGFWQDQDRREVKAKLGRVEEIQQFLRETRPGRVYDTRYEVLTGSEPAAVDAQLRGLAEFVVGGCDDDLLAALHETMQTGHGPNPFGKSRRRKRRGHA